MSNAKKLVSQLRYNVSPRRKFASPEGPKGRLDKISKAVTGLIKYERIELNFNFADETRGYAERLISDAVKYGELHKETMEIAEFWLKEKQLIHKLFKVLVPRYMNHNLSYTKVWRAPRLLPGKGYERCILELRENIYPSLAQDPPNKEEMLHNVLFRAARDEYAREKSFEASARTFEENIVDLNEMKKTSEDAESPPPQNDAVTSEGRDDPGVK